ncbi:MAG: transcription-repair coupling factor, partial [Acidobacteria bacterium]|nr:transcription-repair coupling factor [Acidobacteriota bacterium]
MIHPAIRDLFLALGRHPAFQELCRRIKTPGSHALAGLSATAKALYSSLLWQVSERPLVVLVDGNREAEALSEALETFFDLLVSGRDRTGPLLLPALDVLPLQGMSPHAEILEQRAIGLWKLATRRVPITVLPVASALLRVEPADYYRQLALTLRVGDELPLEDVIAHLESIGYTRRDPVEMVGEYSIRGGILDVFSPESGKPARIDLFGDQVESIRRFEVESQRSVLKLEECTLLPLTEYQKSRAALVELGEKMLDAGVRSRELPPPGETFPGWELLLPMVRPRNSCVFSLFDSPIIVWDEPEQVRGAAERFWSRLEQTEPSAAYEPERIFFRREELEREAAGCTQVSFRELELDVAGEDGLHIPTRPTMAFHGNMQVAIAEARTLVDSGARVAFFGASTGEVERLADIFNEYAIPYQLGLEQSDSKAPAYLAERAYMAGPAASIYLIRGNIRKGVVFSDDALAVFGS